MNTESEPLRHVFGRTSRALLLAGLVGCLLAAGRARAVETFTLAAIGDQQRPVDRNFYTQWYTSFTAQTDWLAANAQADNIRFATQLGDIVEHGSDLNEWNRAAAAMATLDSGVNADGGIGIPWSVAYGNHEADPTQPGTDPAGARANRYREYFGGASTETHRYNGQVGFGGVSSNGLNTYHSIKSSDAPDAREYLLLSLEYDVPGHAPGSSPAAGDIPAFDAIAWAQGIIDANPGKPTIISTHVFEGTAFGPPNSPWEPGPGRNSQIQIFDKLVKNNSQVFMVLGAHTSQDTHQVKSNAFGLPVLQISTDYNKVLPNGGDGFMRLIELDEEAGEIRVETFSPGVPQNPTERFRTDANSQFTIQIDWEARFDVEPPPPPPPPPRVGLIGHWKLDEAPGSTTIVDSSGRWPDGTLSGGPQFVPGKVGNALKFDGRDDRASAADPLTLDLTGPLTLSVWVDLNGDPTSATGQIAGQNTYGGGASDVFYFEYDKGTDTFTFTIAHAGGTRVALDSTTKFTNTDGFVHLAGVFDPGASMKLYVDGVLDATLADASVPAAAQVVHVPFTIGRLNNDAGQFTFNGLIDDVQLYDQALSESNIQFLFENPGVSLTLLSSDLTGNGFVDFEDLTVLLANWNMNVAAADGNLVDPAGTPVNFEDLTVLLAAWTGPAAGGSPQAALGAEAVPEPSGLVLLAVALVGLLGAGGRRFLRSRR